MPNWTEVKNYFLSGQVLTLLLPIALLLFVVWYIRRYCLITQRSDDDLPSPNTNNLFSPGRRRGRLTRKDILPMLLITVLYAALAFFRLGDLHIPQTHWMANEQDSVTFDMGSEVDLYRMTAFFGCLHGNVIGSRYEVETSLDGTNWTRRPPLIAEYGDVFYWREYEMHRQFDPKLGEAESLVYSDDTRARYVRLTSQKIMELKELAIFSRITNADGLSSGLYISPAPFASEDAAVANLFDEQQYVPMNSDEITYMNSAYFDEIYHARTAYENVHDIYPYETTHPPLGKLLISLGIRLFGMVPFGWRFMGTLFGVLMLPLLYWLIKNLFDRTSVAVCGTLLLAFEFMHLTQTRIATIDSYGVFFIIAMYLFMYRYITSGMETSFFKTLGSMLMSGLCFGLGIASKWIDLYAGLGLFFLFLVFITARIMYARQQLQRWVGFSVKTVVCAFLAFIVLPFTIYCASYYPYVATDHVKTLQGWDRNDEQGEPEALPMTVGNLINAAGANSESMYNYHSGLQQTEPHPFAASWFMWLADWRPILFYAHYTNDYNADTGETTPMRSAFASFNNPLISWAGLAALVICLIMFLKRRRLNALFIVVGFLSQLLPWILVPRETYAYHYFPSIVFLILALCYLFNDMMDVNINHRRLVTGFTCVAGGVFLLFLPVLVGIPVPEWYAVNFLRWIPFGVWPF